MSWGWQLLFVPFLIALSAFFVAAEYVVVALRASQVQALRDRGQRRTAAAMARLKADLPSAIGAIQVCITMSNLLLGWLGEPAMSALLDHAVAPLRLALPHGVSLVVSTALSFLVVTLLTVVLSELLPKALTLQHTFVVAALTAVPMLLAMHAIRPMTWLINTLANAITRMLGLGPVQIEGSAHTADEIRQIAAEAGEAGTLSPRERSLILNSLALGRKTAEQIMVPRVRVTYLDLQRSMLQNMRIIEEHLFSRLPLTNGGMDHVIGIVYTKEFLTAYQEPADDSSVLQLIARRPVFVPVGVSLDRLLTIFREERVHMVLLVDEYGGVEGLVTLTDVVDELVGEMAESDA